MNILLWVLQGLLAAHTLMGAVWKFSHSEQTVPSLKKIPHGAWKGLCVIEILCAVALILPALCASCGCLALLGAGVIAAEMLLFCGLHLASGDKNFGPMVYWLGVVVFCAFIIAGRIVVSPF